MITAVSANSGRMYVEKDKHRVECMITNDIVWWGGAFIRGLRSRQYHQRSLPHQNRVEEGGMFYRRQAREDKRRVTKAVRRERGGWGYYLQNSTNKPRDSFSLASDHCVAINVSCLTPVTAVLQDTGSVAPLCDVELQSLTAQSQQCFLSECDGEYHKIIFSLWVVTNVNMVADLHSCRFQYMQNFMKI
jgi:hypothetical protein